LNASTGRFTTSLATAGVFLVVALCFIVFMPDERAEPSSGKP